MPSCVDLVGCGTMDSGLARIGQRPSPASREIVYRCMSLPDPCQVSVVQWGWPPTRRRVTSYWTVDRRRVSVECCVGETTSRAEVIDAGRCWVPGACGSWRGTGTQVARWEGLRSRRVGVGDVVRLGCLVLLGTGLTLGLRGVFSASLSEFCSMEGAMPSSHPMCEIGSWRSLFDLCRRLLLGPQACEVQQPLCW